MKHQNPPNKVNSTIKHEILARSQKQENPPKKILDKNLKKPKKVKKKKGNETKNPSNKITSRFFF